MLDVMYKNGDVDQFEEKGHKFVRVRVGEVLHTYSPEEPIMTNVLAIPDGSPESSNRAGSFVRGVDGDIAGYVNLWGFPEEAIGKAHQALLKVLKDHTSEVLS